MEDGGRPGGPASRKESLMPRYIVERTFPDGLRIPMTGEGAVACLGVVGRNSDLGVTWIHSYVSDDKKKTYCVYDGPDPEAIRKAAQRNGLPVDSINKVSVLDPYFYV
jgi:hypothetical protein